MRKLPALLRNEDGNPVLCAPQVGLFRTSLAAGDEISEGTKIGDLVVLKRRYQVTAPSGVSATVATAPGAGTRTMGYGDPLLELSDGAHSKAGEQSVHSGSEAPAASASGHVVQSPIDGIFYARSSPETAPYVQAGDRISSGQVLGLIEVMKTFNPIRYEGAEGQEATVRSIDVQDQQEVTAGQGLLVLDLD